MAEINKKTIPKKNQELDFQSEYVTKVSAAGCQIQPHWGGYD